MPTNFRRETPLAAIVAIDRRRWMHVDDSAQAPRKSGLMERNGVALGQVGRAGYWSLSGFEVEWAGKVGGRGADLALREATAPPGSGVGQLGRQGLTGASSLNTETLTLYFSFNKMRRKRNVVLATKSHLPDECALRRQ